MFNHNPKKYFIWSVIFFLIVGCDWGGSKKSFFNYKDPHQGYTVKIPKGWIKVEKTPAPLAVFTSPQGDPLQDGGGDCAFSIVTSDSAISTEGEFNKALDLNPQVLDQGYITVDNQIARWLIFEQRGFRTIQYIVSMNDFKIINIFCSASDKFDEYRSLYEEVVDSFRVNN